VGGEDGAAGPFSWQALHSVTPRMLQTTQMNVPQPLHGYPSDARSVLPHARQTIPSISVIAMLPSHRLYVNQYSERYGFVYPSWPRTMISMALGTIEAVNGVSPPAGSPSSSTCRMGSDSTTICSPRANRIAGESVSPRRSLPSTPTP